MIAAEIVADDQPAIQEAIIRLAGQVRLVVTTGGTGIAERDVTPEATRAFVTDCSKALPNGCVLRVQRKLRWPRSAGGSAA